MAKKQIGKEYPPKGEEKLLAKLLEMFTDNYNKFYPDGEKAGRFFHPKPTGCAKAELIVPSDLPEELC